MKTIVQDRDILLQQVTDALCTFFREKPDAVFTMAAGRTMQPVWAGLARAVEEKRVSLARACFFQTAEFMNCPAEQSLRSMTENLLVDKTDLDPASCFWMEGKSTEAFEEEIRQAGGLDLAVLGIGNNAHIGFNEPATPYSSRCHVQKLTTGTRNQYAWRFGSPDAVPESGFTMGIRTLTEAGKIMVLCLGEEKANATFQMLYARDDSVVPAAFLQLPYDVTVYADREAGAKL